MEHDPGPGRTDDGSAIEEGVKSTRAAGLPIRRCDASAFMAVSMLPPAISTSDEGADEGPLLLDGAHDDQQDRPRQEGDPQQPAGPDPVGQVGHHRAGGAGDGDGERQDDAELGVGEAKVRWMLNTMTAQLPQKRPKVTKAATTGPTPTGDRTGVAGAGAPIRTRRRRRPWPGRWPR